MTKELKLSALSSLNGWVGTWRPQGIATTFRVSDEGGNLAIDGWNLATARDRHYISHVE